MLLLCQLHMWSLQLLLLDQQPGLWWDRPAEMPGQGLRLLHLRLPGALEGVRVLPIAALPSKLEPGHRSLTLALAQTSALALVSLPAAQPLLMVAGLQPQTYAPQQPLLRSLVSRDCEILLLVEPYMHTFRICHTPPLKFRLQHSDPEH